MAPLRSRQSAHSARVTLYEPTATAANGTSDVLPTAAASPARRTRSRAAAELDSDIKDEQEEDRKPVKLEAKQEKAKSPRKPKKHVEALAVPHPAPKNWEETYAVIKKQRATIVAPVDNMGCEQGGKDRAKKEEDGEDVKPDLESQQDRRLSILVSLMLSSQTKDPVTHQATMNLRALPGGLTLTTLERSSVEALDLAICKVGFHQTKAASLKRLAVKLREEFDGEVPTELKDLLSIHGVGPKMAFLYLQSIGLNLGIGVDTHVHRITNRLRWHKKETTTPEQTRLNLESWLPKELWPTVNKMLVGFGQEICRPTAPRCDLCDVATARLCPSRRVVPVKSPAKKKLKVELKEEEVKDAGEPELEMKLEVAVEAEAEEVKKEEEVAAGEKEPTRDGAVRRLQEGLLGSADEVVKTA